MKEMVETPRESSRKCVDSELPVIMPCVLLPAAPKFKWGDFDEEEVVLSAAHTPTGKSEDNNDVQEQELQQQQPEEVPPPSGASAQESPSPSPAFSKQDEESKQQTESRPPPMDINMLMERFNGASVRESKERFRQRLWCYLFENLNRAIDELYFLCELECDMEQIEEALLVLNEAGLDFGELKARVQNFDALKKAAGGALQSDETTALEQRPHAIAWEVRRMASSPRRADVLSLSLEAFKKAQHGVTSHDNQQTKRRSAVRFLSFMQDANEGPSEPETHVTNEKEKQTQTVARPPPPPPPPPAAAASASTNPVPSEDRAQEDSSSRADKCAPTEDKHATKTALEAWKEKRNWEDILSSPLSSAASTSKAAGSPGVASGRKSTERGRVLHDKLMSPERKKKTPLEMKKEVDEKQARATRIRRELENERALRLQRTTEKLNRVSEWQAVRSNKLREGMHARQQRGESRHEAHLAQIARRASDQSSKVSEVRFITSLNEENKKLSLQQKLQDSELRRAERLQSLRIKQKEDVAREEAALERRKLLEAERLQRIADTQRKKEEAQARREEERKAASAAREARAVEQVRKKEVRAKAQEEEVELLRQKLAERLRESALRRKIYLEQIRERAVMDTRDQGSPFSRRPASREGQTRITGIQSSEAEMMTEREMSTARLVGGTVKTVTNANHHQVLKKRIRKIRQKLTTRRFDFVETPLANEEGSVAVTATSRSKLGRWLQELQRLQPARKAGAAAMVLIIGEIIKYLDGKEVELHVARHTGLVDFVATALPASHTTKPEVSQTTIALLKVLVILLSLPANRSYFLARNLLPPLVPILSAALENYSSVGTVVGGSAVDDKFGAVGNVLADLLKCVTLVMGHSSSDERQLQMQDDLVELIVACDIIHRLRNVFALFDRPQVEGAPFPPPVLLGLKLLDTLTRRKLLGNASPMASQFSHFLRTVTSPASSLKKHVETQEKDVCMENSDKQVSETADKLKSGEAEDKSEIVAKVIASQDTNTSTAHPVDTKSREESKRLQYVGKSVGFLLVAIADTGLVGLPSLLTAVLLQANPRASSAEQAVFSLPANFEEVATGVLRVLNNTACLDLSLVQTMLSLPDLKMEFFHLVSFLLSYCTCKWKAATDQVASLLLETLLLLGYFALLHSGNQAVLRWGKSPTILHKMCDLPFAFFSDPELSPILVGTLLAACYGSERNRDVIQQELSMELLLSVLKGHSDNNSDRQGVQSAEGMLSKARRMDVITEESEEEMDQDRVVEELEVTPCRSPLTATGRITSKQPKRLNKLAKSSQDTTQLPLVFLLENRFPSSLWDNAIEFFSCK